MIQLKTFLKVIDNSGGLVAECINVMGGSRVARVGDEIVVAIKKAKPSLTPKLKKGDVARAVVVRCVKDVARLDGSRVGFDDNACVIINKQGQPIGNRILGPIAEEVRQKRWAKLVSIAPRVV